MLHYQNLRQLIFRFDPEVAHSVVEFVCALAPKIPALLPFLSKKFCFNDPLLSQEIDGMRFYNPVGLAAGFDKNATMVETLCALGFSHLELGALTPLAQSGNEKPRLWRHTNEESIQNAMGFNNDGANAVSMRLDKCYPFVLPLGINIGKNKLTSQENAIEDYIALAKTFSQNSDYLSVNISSPNTPNLRDLQNEAFIKELFSALCEIYKKPIYLKISPDLSIDSALNLVECAMDFGAKGIIATNTTLDYSLVANPKEKGGISGKVLAPKSREMLKQIALTLKAKKRKATLISVGGIADAKEAYLRIRLGASLVQVFSAMIFKGPSLVKCINRDLKDHLERDGFNHISEAVGVDL
ncbi:dihydroorotate dehydrogenase (quinone) [Helicobacter turcicus]|uniref:Dihydroorotate dehydrogenase (quinone) n=1 Tax=Helicobacter turcicus TaxID=2867412 RepID=A0ABS7JM67_9HELI|nr:dihydroorotate dehydrogenase (quinone) [Helicobacter turcicus]MBX7490487.1 dihydroorotate dehydrogenase (quinone) [Helicobacter turcicus]MBX7545347.1 dihydroorotate dehydrogenase (quinone) [Helicobacter turcicus]